MCQRQTNKRGCDGGAVEQGSHGGGQQRSRRAHQTSLAGPDTPRPRPGASPSPPPGCVAEVVGSEEKDVSGVRHDSLQTNGRVTRVLTQPSSRMVNKNKVKKNK